MNSICSLLSLSLPCVHAAIESNIIQRLQDIINVMCIDDGGGLDFSRSRVFPLAMKNCVLRILFLLVVGKIQYESIVCMMPFVEYMSSSSQTSNSVDKYTGIVSNSTANTISSSSSICISFDEDIIRNNAMYILSLFSKKYVIAECPQFIIDQRELYEYKWCDIQSYFYLIILFVHI
jgi:hypothetical protein